MTRDILTVATWNTEWSTTKNPRGQRVAARLKDTAADVLVVTEGNHGLLPTEGHIVDAGADWGYGAQATRRKVLIWSRGPISVDHVAASGAARGRLMTVSTETPIGPVRVVGVCIPWAHAHVTTGRSDATPWSEHLQYLDQLSLLLPDVGEPVPTVVAGDFNQRIPRGRQPIRVASALAGVFDGWNIHTTGDLEYGPHIDHIATGSHLRCRSVDEWPGHDALGRLSDHGGVSCRLRRA